MTRAARKLESQVQSRHREVRVIACAVILALAGGIALLWPSVQQVVVDRFGPRFPARFLMGDLLGLVVLFVAYLWRKAGQTEHLIRNLLEERDRTQRLEGHLADARAVLQASALMNVDEDAAASLDRILRCVTEALRAERGVLYRTRGENRPPEREAVYPSQTEAPEPLALAFEDEITRKVLQMGTRLVVDSETDLKELGVGAARPRHGWERLLAAPLLLEGRPAGVLLLCDPAVATGEDGPDPRRLELLDVFAGFAAGVLSNLKTFQAIARRNQELNRARQLLYDHQRELAEIEAVATMACVARSLAHGLADPLTAIAGYTDVVLTSKPDALMLKGAREGLRREIEALKTRLTAVVDFTKTWRRRYGIVDLNQVVETAVALHAEAMRARGVTLHFDPHPGLPYTVADPVRLRQVFLSLLTFAQGCVSSDEGAQEIRVRTLADQGRLRVNFEFRGRAGVAEFITPLLDPNVEVATLARERAIDLPVAVAIVREHEGDLRIETLDERRIRIVVDLPVQSEAPETRRQNVANEELSLDEVLTRIFDDPAVGPIVPHHNVAPNKRLPSHHVPVASAAPAAPPATAAATTVPMNPLRLTRGAHPPAPELAKPAAPAAPVAGGLAAVRPATSGEALDAIFHPGDIWTGPQIPVLVPKSAVNAQKPPRRRSLLDQAELEGVLKMFDEVTPVEPTKEP